ncbi:hypothetical protein PVAP13_6NG129400 [Panicum virgatum]|uniref:Uncharacterized protein n=1 Tax=Panicum virgatum TaxID=38727 RepID=A0A8T0QY59_PANVG|nr:hypothetical protein PVAP13_6NG129400 [Panicum virgatum]
MQILFELLDLSSSTSKRPFQCLPLFNDIYFSYSELFCSFCFSSDLYIEQILCKGTWRAVSLLVSLIFYSHHHSAAATFFYIRQHKLLQSRRNTSGGPTPQGRHVCLHDGESHAGNQSLQEAPFVQWQSPSCTLLCYKSIQEVHGVVLLLIHMFV